jgi:hypothetical protein
MARFEINTPLITREPTVTVDAGLAIGRHRFRLEVIDAQRRTSLPHEAIVEVQRIVVDPQPTGPIGPVGPVIDPVGPVVGPVRPVIEPAPVIGRVTPAGGTGTSDEPAPRPRTRRKKEKP